jgi:hypothetical protein
MISPSIPAKSCLRFAAENDSLSAAVTSDEMSDLSKAREFFTCRYLCQNSIGYIAEFDASYQVSKILLSRGSPLQTGQLEDICRMLVDPDVSMPGIMRSHVELIHRAMVERFSHHAKIV